MNDKSVLVIDTPKCCYECDYCRFHGKVGYRKCLLSKGEGRDFIDVQDGTIDILKERHKCCPLRPLPKYLGFKETETETTDWHFGDNLDRADGWNACLDEILGEENE